MKHVFNTTTEMYELEVKHSDDQRVYKTYRNDENKFCDFVGLLSELNLEELPNSYVVTSPTRRFAPIKTIKDETRIKKIAFNTSEWVDFLLKRFEVSLYDVRATIYKLNKGRRIGGKRDLRVMELIEWNQKYGIQELGWKVFLP